ncbi:MAG TPA: tetratricopeptide repeat protein, partial [Isosphaeraceae bacterium]
NVAVLLDKIKGEPSLVQQHAEALALFEQINQDLDHRARYLRYIKGSIQAHYYETNFTGLGELEVVKKTRASARAALGALATEGTDGSWTFPRSLPEALTPRERTGVEDDRYALLLILGEAEAQPLDDEDPRAQAARGLRILDAAARLRPAPSQAFHLRRASCLDRAGDAKAAAVERSRAEGLKPSTPFDHFLSGQERYKQRDWPAAMLEFDAVLQQQPGDFWAKCLLAICQLNATPSRPGEARAGLTSCIERLPDHPWLYLLRGFASGQMATMSPRPEAVALFEDAEADYDRALARMNPDTDDELRYILFVNRGVLHHQRQQWAAAVTDLEAAIKINPSKAFPYNALSDVYARQNRLADALTWLTKAIRHQADGADLYLKRARLHVRRHEIDPALIDLGDAIRLAESGSLTRAAAHLERGRLLHGRRHYDEALADYDTALTIAPTDAETHRLRADALLKLGRDDEVIGSCDAYLAGGRPSADLHHLRGLARADLDDQPGAIEDFTQSLALRPNTP